MTQRIDITGKQFGRLTVIEYIGGSKWACRCLCGGESFVASADLRNGHTTSCGCVQKERAAQANTTHGYSRSPTYESWCKMVSRCTNPTTTQYQWYGGKGVTIHAAWRASFEQFVFDMGARPGVEYELDRIDPNGNYEPNNCRWWVKGKGVTTKSILFQGKTCRQWAEELDVTHSTITYRLRKHGTVFKKERR